MPLKRSSELLDLGATHGRIPALCLDIDHVEAEAILLDDAVDSSVTTLPDCLSGISERSAVAHPDKEFYDEAFEECRGRTFHLIEEFGFEVKSETAVCCIKGFFRSRVT